MRTLLFAAMLSVALAGAATSAQAHGQDPRQYHIAEVQGHLFVVHPRINWIVVRKNGEVHGWEKRPSMDGGDWPEYGSFTHGQFELESNGRLDFTAEPVPVYKSYKRSQ